MIHTIILYGSEARKESDKFSDIDICIIIDRMESAISVTQELEKLNYNFKEHEVTIHDEIQFNKMLKKGSLFLWHIKLEGKILHDENNYFNIKINQLNKFKDYKGELIYYNEILTDLEKSILELNFQPNFDCALLFTLIRNSCILISYKDGNPHFGRESAFAYCKKFVQGFDFNSSNFKKLLDFKLRYERGSDINRPKIEMDSAISMAKGILEFAERHCSNEKRNKKIKR